VVLALYNAKFLTLLMKSIKIIVDEVAKIAMIDSKEHIRLGIRGEQKQITEEKAR
jgi:hypothetical protein